MKKHGIVSGFSKFCISIKKITLLHRTKPPSRDIKKQVDIFYSIGAGGLTGSGADGVIESIYSGSTGSTGETLSGFIGGTTSGFNGEAGAVFIGGTAAGFNGADGLSGFLEAGEDDSIGTSEPCSTVAVRVVGGLIPDFEIDAGAGAAIGVVVGGVGRSFLRTGDNSGVICEGGRGGGG